MELQDLKMVSSQDDNKEEVVVDEEEERLPGFRFHPTDEELVTFYLRRKIEKKPISIQIIKQIDIYKHDPWEFAKGSSVGDNEWYFYCKRGRKYRNSVRPNRVTASGFWKATGIDKPIYSDGHRCVGLKKSLVYYRGSAGKGTKTDWMMHEFRLPPQQHSGSSPRDTLQEAEIWTLCRIFKRNRKYTPDWREVSAKTTTLANSSSNNNNNITMGAKTRSFECINDRECYISFFKPVNHLKTIEQQNLSNKNVVNLDSTCSTHLTGLRSAVQTPPKAQAARSDTSDFSSSMNPLGSVDGQGSPFLAGYCGDWDDLSSVVEFAINKPPFLS